MGLSSTERFRQAADADPIVATPPAPATILGMVDAVAEYGADGTGKTDASAQINAALAAHSVVVIPAGAVCACNSPIVIGFQKTLINLGVLIRKSALTSSTRPVVILNADYACVKGGGRAAGLVHSENDSPDGIVLWGVEAPVRSAPSTAIRWANVQDIMVFGNGSPSSRGIVCQSMQAYGIGALFDAHFHNIHVYNVAEGIYSNSIANGNTFDKINFYDIHRYAIHVNGASEDHDGRTFQTSDNSFLNMFVDRCPASFQAVIRGRSCTLTNFIGVHAEPDAGAYVDMDRSCSRITLVSTQNMARTGVFDAQISTFIVNGVANISRYAGQMYSSTGLSPSVASGAPTPLFSLPTKGEFYEVTAYARGNVNYAATCIAVRSGSGVVSLLNNSSTTPAFRLTASGANVQVTHAAGVRLPVEWRIRIMSAYA